MTDGQIVHRYEVRNDERDLLYVPGRRGELSPQWNARLRGNIIDITTTQTLLLRITHDKVFLLAGSIDHVNAADAVVIIAAFTFLPEGYAKLEFFIRIVDHRELQRHRVAARSLQFLDLYAYARQIAISRRDCRACRRRRLRSRLMGSARFCRSLCR